MRIGVLGTTVAELSDAPITLGGPKQRALLAALALHPGRPVAVDTLADLVWDGAPPPGAPGTLQGYVSGLRRALEPGRTARGAGGIIVTEPPGYALKVAAGELDVTAFESTQARIHAAVAPLAERLLRESPAVPAPRQRDELSRLHSELGTALEQWRGSPFVELGEADAARAERSRLEELRVLALEDRAVLAVLLGRHSGVVAELDALSRAHPLRERLWALRAVALARSGRQADALTVLAQVRTLLDEELGLEPGPELRATQVAVLRQDVGAATTSPTGASTVRLTPWPLAGRDDEVRALTQLLDQVVATPGPAYAALTGEPGIGKSRLASELAAYAEARGTRVVVGRCSQDDGAPALWPWRTVLQALGSDLPSSDDEVDGAAAFRAWESVVSVVLNAAEEQPLLVVLDDLHWADESTLRVLRLLAETSTDTGARLLLLATWREHPAPVGALADVAEVFARRHALRLSLRGLGVDDAARVVREVSATTPSPEEAAALRERTDGNPFFLVEYARLAGERGDLGRLLTEVDPPEAVHDVVSRRLGRLTDETRGLVHRASVLGRVFELDVLAAATGLEEDAALDALEPAIEAGLVAEEGVDRFRFTHALVRDTALTGLPQARRARVHARAAAALAGRPGREAEIARHWLSAGPGARPQAWRAAAAAGRAAASVHAYMEALEMLEQALRAQREDPVSGPQERFEVLSELAEVLRRAGRWSELRDVAHEAFEMAEEADDVDLLVRAGVMTSTGALWQGAGFEVDEVMVHALRTTLARLPAGDDRRTCLTMLALASESYYGASPQETEALAEEAVAMARRLGEGDLTLWACLHAQTAMWRGSNAQVRFDLSGEAVALAAELGDDLAGVAALTLRAVTAGELGLVDVMDEASRRARAQAEHHRHLYAQIVLDSLNTSWQAMRGEFDAAEATIAHLVSVGPLLSIRGFDEATAGAITVLMLWQGRNAEMVETMLALEPSTAMPLDPTLVTLMCRAGMADEARERFDTHQRQISTVMASDLWYSPMGWSTGAEAALHLADPALAATAYERLAPLAGRPACAGSGTAIGPVDAFLAMAACATGERELATRHANRAEELCEQWRVPLAAQWVRRERERFGF